MVLGSYWGRTTDWARELGLRSTLSGVITVEALTEVGALVVVVAPLTVVVAAAVAVVVAAAVVEVDAAARSVSVAGGAAVPPACWPVPDTPRAFWVVEVDARAVVEVVEAEAAVVEVDADPAAVVDVDPPGVVVVVVPVWMVPSAPTGTVASTGRNCSSAVSPTSWRAWSLFLTPGISTRMLLPWRDTWASATPSALMR